MWNRLPGAVPQASQKLESRCREVPFVCVCVCVWFPREEVLLLTKCHVYFYFPTFAVFECVDKLLISLTYRLVSVIVELIWVSVWHHLLNLLLSQFDWVQPDIVSPNNFAVGPVLLRCGGNITQWVFPTGELTEVLVLKSQPPANTGIFWIP